MIITSVVLSSSNGAPIYAKAELWHEINSDLDFTQTPNLIRTDPRLAAISAEWAFMVKTTGKGMDIDDNTTTYDVTANINGGESGLAERRNFFEKLKQFITDCITNN